jgi:hypothetical protein
MKNLLSSYPAQNCETGSPFISQTRNYRGVEDCRVKDEMKVNLRAGRHPPGKRED